MPVSFFNKKASHFPVIFSFLISTSPLFPIAGYLQMVTSCLVHLPAVIWELVVVGVKTLEVSFLLPSLLHPINTAVFLSAQLLLLFGFSSVYGEKKA